MNVTSRTGGCIGDVATLPSAPVQGPAGQPTVLGSGGLEFRCVEPFRIWTMRYHGNAVRTSSFDLVEGKKDGPLVDVGIHVEAIMVVPPWVQGALQPEARAQLKTSVEGELTGGARYEQLFRAAGSVTVDDAEHRFTGSGLRIRRWTTDLQWGICLPR